MDDFKVSDLRTTVELLEILRKYQISKGFSGTDYRLAKILQINPNSAQNLIHKGGIMSDETAMHVAHELGLPSSYVLLCAWHERNKNEATKEAIKEIADKYLKVSVFILVASVIFNTSSLLYALA